MRRRIRPGLAALAFLLGTAALAGEAKVTYFTGRTIYLDAGRAEGLAAGQEVTVTRGGQPVAACRVTEVSEHKAACAVESQVLEPAPGDAAAFAGGPDGGEDAARPAPARGTARRARRGSGLRGRVGLRYLYSRDSSAAGSTYSQPALDLRLDGAQLGGTPWGVNLDARARRTSVTLGDGTSQDDQLTKVYRAALTRLGVDDPWNVTVGRQFAPAAASVSVFDGVTVEFARPRVAFGALSGTQPDPANYGYSSQTKEHGVYAQFRNAGESSRRYVISTGLIGSYEGSELNREFAYVQTRLWSARFSLWATQELDFNRGWKADAGESAVSPTATFASLSYRPRESLTLQAGYDNRRNVRLYRDFVNPVTQFDDSFRQGVWAGLTQRLGQRYTIGLDARTHGGGAGGASTSYTASFGADQLAGRFDVRVRSTEYDGDLTRGWLHSLTAGTRIGRALHVQLGGGLRAEDSASSVVPAEDLVWYSADLDLLLGRHVYLILSADRTSGDQEDTDQYYGGLTYRF